jgi:hypothetical protein
MNYHVYPINDLEDHDLDTHLCTCQPSIEYINGSMLIIHNSFDGRELVEEANQILNSAKEKSPNP